MAVARPSASGSARDIKRREDPALLTGAATYVNDFTLPGMLHAAVLRSPHAHARIVVGRLHRGAPGARGRAGRALGRRAGRDHRRRCRASARRRSSQHAVAVDKVRYAGEAVAIAVAETRYQAEDALDAGRDRVRAAAAARRRGRGGDAGRAARARERSARTSSTRRRSRTATSRATSRAPRTSCSRTLRWPRVTRLADGDRRRGRATSTPPPAGWTCALQLEHAQLRGLGARPARCKMPPRAARLPPDVHAAAASAPSTCLAKVIALAGAMSKLTRPAGEVHGGPRGQPAGQRRAGARPPLRGRAGDRRRRHASCQSADRRGRRLRRLLPVRGRRQHERDGADHRPVRDRQRASTRVQGRADQQEPAGRVPRRGLRGRQLGARAARRRGRRRSSGSTASSCAGAT